jgi:hypothetical protein
MIYLASPYSDEDPKVQQRRYEAVRKMTAGFLERRFFIYSPIVHCHDLAAHHDLPKDFEFWRDYDFHMLDLAEQLWVLMLDGWNTSKGVTAEVLHWRQRRDTRDLHYVQQNGMFDL